MAEAEFRYPDLLLTGADDTPHRPVTTEGVSAVEGTDGQQLLEVAPEAMHDIAHYLRSAHPPQVPNIIEDPEASGNDRFVAPDLSRLMRDLPGLCTAKS